jgi:hypothetical protein
MTSTFDLFYKFPVYAVFDKWLADIANEITEKSPDYVLNVNADEWGQYFVNKYSQLPLTIYADKVTVEFHSKMKRQIEQYGRQVEQEEFKFRILIPYTGSSFLFQCRPSTYSMETTKVEVPAKDSGNLIAYIINEQNPEKFENEKKRLLNFIESNIKNINKDVIGFNLKIALHFKSIYESEIKRIKKERIFFEAINIRINDKTEQIFNPPTIAKKKIPEPVLDSMSPKRFTDVPTFPDNLYMDVLSVIYNCFKSVENKPKIYQRTDEEGLRDYLLPLLETRYVGTTATGETFNKFGRTDILLKYQDGSNLFVAECKFWKGETQFLQTINQLFDRYLTWRDSKVAIIFFVKNKDFSAALDVIKESVKKHPYFFKENGIRRESSFSYLFHFPNDSQKIVHTEVMAFAFNQINSD